MTNKSSNTNKQKMMIALENEVLNFTDHPLYQFRVENNYLPVVGEGSLDAKVMFVGEAPGKKEAETGRPFCGASGKILDQLLASISLDRDMVYVTSIVKDRPPKNRDPNKLEIELHAPFLERQIDLIEPEIVATLGRYSMNFMLENYNNNSEKLPITEARGTLINLETSVGKKFKLLPLYHPAVALYSRKKLPLLLNDFQVLKELID